MASYAIAAGKKAAHNKTLVATVADEVDIADNVSAVQIVTDGAAAIYYTVDGSTPTVGGDNCFMVPAAPGVEERPIDSPGPSVIKLISSGTPTYSVQKLH